MTYRNNRRTQFRENRFCLVLAGLMLGCSLLFSATPASAGNSALFILDVSGSMWGRIEGDMTKIEAARTVMGKLLSEVPDKVSTGFIAYGHRRKGDCGDIELIEKPHQGAGPKIATSLNRLNPRGKTPISDSLMTGAKALQNLNGDKTLVLVSDGIETCKGDPCAVADSLREANADLKIHVVGYAVGKDARHQLQCVAKKGGGRYFTADNVSGLKTALSTVTTAIVKQKPVPAPPVVEAPKVEQPVVESKVNTTRIKIKGPGTIKVVPAPWVKMPPYFWKVTDPETGKEVGSTKKELFRVKAGTYQITWRHVEHGARAVELPEIVTVESGKVVEARIDTGLRITPPQGTKRPYFWRLLDSEKKRVAEYSVWDPVPVPGGRYRLILRQSEHGHKQADLGEIDIKPGKLNDVVLDQGLNLQWPEAWTPQRKHAVYYLDVKGKDGHVGKFSYRGPIFLSPGKYKLTFRLKEHGWSGVDWGEVEVPEKGFVDLKINSGLTFLSKEEKPKHIIFATNLETNKKASIRNHWGPFPLPPGRYRIDMKPGRSDTRTIIDEVEIKDGQMVEVEMD